MFYGITTLATDFSKEEMSSWRVRFFEALFFFVPRANPDNERHYPQVRSWALELDASGWPRREVGLDGSGTPLFRAPDDRNTGFWPDMARRQFDHAELEPITEESFNALWVATRDAA